MERGGKWRDLKRRLRFKAAMIGCCGSSWSSNRVDLIEEEEEHDLSAPQPDTERQIAADDPPAMMNLAAALEAERHFRESEAAEEVVVGTPNRVSLMRLLEEGEVGGDAAAEEGGGEGGGGWCCVCMGRRKGAAFIPCGHTFCRVCSRELWLNRGSCPLCNRPIIDILDIF